MNKDLWKIINKQVEIRELEKHYPLQKVITGQCVEPYVKRDGRTLLQFTSLDYLSLSRDQRVVDAASDAIEVYGVGSLASPLITGTLDIHLDLHRELADYMSAPSSLTFTSGMLTNIGSISAIIDSQFRFLFGKPSRATRAIFTDELNHKSIRMACDMSEGNGVKVFTYRHCNVENLVHILNKNACDLNLIITDAVFSMDGDVAPLREIVDVAKSHSSEEHSIVVYADDAHGVGVLGANGRGACELCGVEKDVVRMGVISKAFGTLGGYVVGEDWFINYLRHCTTQMFSMGVPAAEVAATRQALKIARDEPWRRGKVLDHANYLRRVLTENGYEVIGNTHIVPIIIGNEDEVIRVASKLEERGILAPEIKYPAVPKGRARIRLSPVYSNTKDDLDYFLNTFTDIVLPNVLRPISTYS